MSGKDGFTLIEILIATIVVGVISMILVPVTQTMLDARDTHYRTQQDKLSLETAHALLEYADKQDGSNAGRLPAPNDNSVDTGDSDVFEMLLVRGVPATQIEHDDTQAENKRVYARIQSDVQVPFFRDSQEPKVELKFDYGIVYLAACPQAEFPCSESRSVPTNISDLDDDDWLYDTEDLEPQVVSTEDMQLERLRGLEERIRDIRDRILADFRERQRDVEAKDISDVDRIDNSSAPSATSVGSGTCNSTWRTLDGGTMLSELGLQPEVYGETPWGGDVTYCNDYEASGGSDITQSALAVAKDGLTNGSSPSSGDYIIISF